MKSYEYDCYGTIYNIILTRSTYPNKNTAIIATTTNGEPFGVFSVNLGVSLPKDYAYIDTNNMPNAMDFLIKNHFGKYAEKSAQSGFCVYPLMKINLDMIPEA